MKRSADEFQRLARATPARLAVGRAGARYTTRAMLKFRADHARAVDAVRSELPENWAKRHGLIEVHSQAESREAYLLRPELGRRLAPSDVPRLKRLRPAGKAGAPSVMLCVGDGLSCAAVHAHAPALLRALTSRIRKSCRMLPPVFVRNARVRVQDHIGEIARPDVIVMIVGERPGLATAESLSAYVIWRPRLSSIEPDRTVISNIHPGGLSIPRAAAKIANLVNEVIANHASGAALADRMASHGA